MRVCLISMYELTYCFFYSVTGRFAYKSFRQQVDSPTSRSFRLHDQSRFTFTVWVDSPKSKSIRLH